MAAATTLRHALQEALTCPNVAEWPDGTYRILVLSRERPYSDAECARIASYVWNQCPSLSGARVVMERRDTTIYEDSGRVYYDMLIQW